MGSVELLETFNDAKDEIAKATNDGNRNNALALAYVVCQKLKHYHERAFRSRMVDVKDAINIESKMHDLSPLSLREMQNNAWPILSLVSFETKFQTFTVAKEFMIAGNKAEKDIATVYAYEAAQELKNYKLSHLKKCKVNFQDFLNVEDRMADVKNRYDPEGQVPS